MALPKNTANIITGRMQPIMTRVSYQEIIKTKIKATIMKRKDLINIDTFVERPSYTTVMSAPKRLTIKN
jgi:hypothetical protein